ncbi:MAG: hypothetical protein RIQ56_927 [Candidatus Parcubacteria bacterium]|jgi:hypothetical protein
MEYVFLFLLILGAIAVYFLPTIIAKSRHSKSADGVLVVNLFLGWTFIGWVVALAWAAASHKLDEGSPKKQKKGHSVGDELAKLAQLHKDGVLTEGELKAQKEALLRGI